jgi:transglutaminase superfamily protein
VRVRGAAAATAAVLSLLGIPSAAAAQAVAYVGSDRVRLELPAGGLVEGYSNAGYRLRVDGGTATVEVDLAPLRSRQPFALAAGDASADGIPTLARAVATGAATRYDAVTRVLQWVGRNVAYDLDREEPQDAAAVLARRSGYCTGIARLSVALLQALDIPAREVPGFLVAPAGAGVGSRVLAGFHRWVEVHYDDVGWVFSDPLLALHYVPATYVRLGSESLLPEAEQLPGRLLSRDDRRVAVDLFAEASPQVTVRRNDVVRRAAALRVTMVGAPTGRAVLEGVGSRRVRALDRGESTFVGLEPGSYLLRVEVDGASPSLKRVILRDRVWGSVHLPAPAALEPIAPAYPSPPFPAQQSPRPTISEEEST